MVCIQAIEDYSCTSQNGNADGMKYILMSLKVNVTM